MNNTAIVWLRNDLRLLDNPALWHGCANYSRVIIAYIYDENFGGEFKIGGASKWWLHHSLQSLSKEIELNIFSGKAIDLIPKLVQEHEVSAVFWNRCYEPSSIERDTEIKKTLKNLDVKCESFNASLLFEPWELKPKTSNFYSVYTPFWKACLSKGVTREALAKPNLKNAIKINSAKLSDLSLLPTKPDWASGFRENWNPGEKNALKILDDFIENSLSKYSDGRNFPAIQSTSRLSPHLRFGEISPLYIWNAVNALYASKRELHKEGEKFLSELGWREFSYHLLYHFPDMPAKNFKTKFDGFEWHTDLAKLKAWQKGTTGYPIVDAGMRELWQTGYMHNRVRMIAASFLIKDLFIDWREGQAWFWDTLVDADLANNSCSWQWVAGSGADAAPYFRIFNPVLQGEKFDPNGEYVKRWVTELNEVPKQFIHQPWKYHKKLNYPNPIVDHDICRKLALEKYKNL